MLPTASALRPSARSRWATSAVTVVFPLVPVTAMHGTPASAPSASSTSLMTSTRAWRAAVRGAASGGMPGLATTSRAPAIRARSCPPTSTSTPSRTQPVGAAADRLTARRIRRVHPRPAPSQELRRGHPAATESQHRHLAGREVACRHRSLSVASATNAQRMPRIQNRTTTCVSFQPIISKWWCSGARRNTRCACAYANPCRRFRHLERRPLDDHRCRLGGEDAAQEQQQELALEQDGDRRRSPRRAPARRCRP